MTDTHMRLTVGYNPARAGCDPEIGAPLTVDPYEVTCPECSTRVWRTIARQEREQRLQELEEG